MDDQIERLEMISRSLAEYVQSLQRNNTLEAMKELTTNVNSHLHHFVQNVQTKTGQARDLIAEKTGLPRGEIAIQSERGRAVFNGGSKVRIGDQRRGPPRIDEEGA